MKSLNDITLGKKIASFFVFSIVAISILVMDGFERENYIKTKINELNDSVDLIRFFSKSINNNVVDLVSDVDFEVEKLLLNKKIFFNKHADVKDNSLNLFKTIEKEYGFTHLKNKNEHLLYLKDYLNKVIFSFSSIEYQWSEKEFKNIRKQCLLEKKCDLLTDGFSIDDNVIISYPYIDVVTSNTTITVSSFINANDGVYVLSEDIYINWDKDFVWESLESSNGSKVIGLFYDGFLSFMPQQETQYQIDDATILLLKKPFAMISLSTVIKLLILSSFFMVFWYLYFKVNVQKNEIFIDETTGVFNKKLLTNESLKKKSSFAKNMYVAVIDGNGIKNINDRFGHYVGDQAIKFIATYLKRNVRSNDMIIRFGGDEFVLLLFDFDSGYVNDFIEKIKNIRKERFPVKSHGLAINVSVSIGMSKVNGNLSSALEIADKKMYVDKNSEA